MKLWVIGFASLVWEALFLIQGEWLGVVIALPVTCYWLMRLVRSHASK